MNNILWLFIILVVCALIIKVLKKYHIIHDWDYSIPYEKACKKCGEKQKTYDL